jgi:glyoxylase-like metal-dependent hydrolase (beta-lactamase superfamily II)
MKLDRISESVYSNTEEKLEGNVGIVVLDEKVLVVDAMFPVSAYDFRESIPKVTDKPVTHLLLTHIHPDHVFGSQAFEDCEIVAHRRLKEKMEENLRAVWAPGNLDKRLEEMIAYIPERAALLSGLRIVLPTATFEEEHVIDDIEMTHMGGHTDCSSVVYIPEDRVLFSGDLMFSGTFPWGGDPTADPDTWIEALGKIVEMDVEKIVPGHGPICGKDEFIHHLKWLESLRDEMKKLIEGGASEDEAVIHDGYPPFYEAVRDRKERSFRHFYRTWKRKLS